MARRPPETQWRFIQNVRPRPWSVRNRREVHDLDNEKKECELDEDFRLGNLLYLHIENTLESLTTWLDEDRGYTPCPTCLHLPEYDSIRMESDDQRLLFYVDKKHLIQLLLDIVAIPSPTLAEGALATYLANFLSKMGLDVQLQPVEDHAGTGCKSQQPIACWSGSQDGPTILLISHMDHHPPQEGWDHPPFQGQVERGWVYGCGVQDGKGSIATMLIAIRALKEARLDLKGKVILAPVAGHNQGQVGMHGLLASGLRADWAIDVENTDLNILTDSDSANSRLVRTLGKWHKRVVQRRAVISDGAFRDEMADGHLSAKAGIPTVLYGPGDGCGFKQSPSANERIWIEDLTSAAGIIALTVRDILS